MCRRIGVDATLLPSYRVLSTLIHPGFLGVSAYLAFVEGEFAGFRSDPDTALDGQLGQVAACLLWSLSALNAMLDGGPHPATGPDRQLHCAESPITSSTRVSPQSRGADSGTLAADSLRGLNGRIIDGGSRLGNKSDVPGIATFGAVVCEPSGPLDVGG